jgi:carbon storage regulator
MLVLSRRANQSIIIGSDVVVTVLEVRGDHVRLGIQAPRSVTVHREEVYAEIQRENRSAATVAGTAVGALPRPPR